MGLSKKKFKVRMNVSDDDNYTFIYREGHFDEFVELSERAAERAKDHIYKPLRTFKREMDDGWYDCLDYFSS